jgi:hypothetical protein
MRKDAVYCSGDARSSAESPESRLGRQGDNTARYRAEEIASVSFEDGQRNHYRPLTWIGPRSYNKTVTARRPTAIASSLRLVNFQM